MNERQKVESDVVVGARSLDALTSYMEDYRPISQGLNLLY